MRPLLPLHNRHNNTATPYICVWIYTCLLIHLLMKNENLNNTKSCVVSRDCVADKAVVPPFILPKPPDTRIPPFIHQDPSTKLPPQKSSSQYIWAKFTPEIYPFLWFVRNCSHFFTILPHKDPWKKHHTPPLCKSSFFGKSHPTHMLFLLLSQQKRRLRFRNLLWSSFIPSGSLMISPDPPVHNCTLLYGTVRFTKKRACPHALFAL